MVATVRCPRLTIAALRGSAGKTVVTIGLTAAFRAQGRRVAPMKKGPDYIDAAWLAAAAGRRCTTLDTYLMDRPTILEAVAHAAAQADLILIEGNRGLYDGLDPAGTHSTAELAKLLGSPVVLVADCGKTSRTMAAMVLGCQKLDPTVRLAGVILNHVRGARHEAIVTAAVEETCGVPVLGAIPPVDDLALPERHLGLSPPTEQGQPERVIAQLADLAGRYLDLQGLYQAAMQSAELPVTRQPARVGPAATGRPRIGVVRDRAFWFYYPENLEALEARGAELVPIDALTHPGLPAVDALYIGGGFPETQADRLAQNAPFRASVRAAANQGLPIYAECGGLVFLGEALWWQGRRYPMAGVLPAEFAVEPLPQAHGYTCWEVDRDNPYFEVGEVLRGHEFHYSRVARGGPSAEQLVMSVRRGGGIAGRREGWCWKNVLATYGHLHALGSPAWADALVRVAAAHRSRRGVCGSCP